MKSVVVAFVACLAVASAVETEINLNFAGLIPSNCKAPPAVEPSHKYTDLFTTIIGDLVAGDLTQFDAAFAPVNHNYVNGVDQGEFNWGVPKELTAALFAVMPIDDVVVHYVQESGHTLVAEVTLKFKIVATGEIVPFNTALRVVFNDDDLVSEFHQNGDFLTYAALIAELLAKK